MDIRVIYFDTPFWRAEVSRLALFIGDIPFEDMRIDKDEFVIIKKTGEMSDGTKIPFKQLPALSVMGKTIGQTGAIARFCGKIANLYPDDIWECAQIDQIIDLGTDINVLIRPSMLESDPVKKKALRVELSNTILPGRIQLLENLVSAKENKNFCVGNSLSIADLAVWRLMGWLSSGVIDDISPNLVEPFDAIMNICRRVESLPKVVEWIDNTYPTNYRSFD